VTRGRAGSLKLDTGLTGKDTRIGEAEGRGWSKQPANLRGRLLHKRGPTGTTMSGDLGGVGRPSKEREVDVGNRKKDSVEKHAVGRAD